MSNRAKRNLFLALLIAVGLGYVALAILKSQFNAEVEWWIFSLATIIFAFLWGGFRNFSQAVKEDKKYGSLKTKQTAEQ